MRIPAEHVPVFAALRDLSPEKLTEAGAGLASLGKRPRARDLAKVLASVGLRDPEVAAEVLGQLAIAARARTPGTLLQEVAGALFELWTKAELEKWAQRQHAIQQIIATEPLFIFAKANQLRFEHENIFEDARVLTDVRPIFDREAATLVAGIVCQTLRLRYIDASRSRQYLSVALDSHDLEQLVKVCQRALKKGHLLEGYLAAPTPLPSLMEGDDEV